jgi:hypothetical protein
METKDFVATTIHQAHTKQDSFPMPLIKDVLMQLEKSSWFSTFDF